MLTLFSFSWHGVGPHTKPALTTISVLPFCNVPSNCVKSENAAKRMVCSKGHIMPVAKRGIRLMGQDSKQRPIAQSGNAQCPLSKKASLKRTLPNLVVRAMNPQTILNLCSALEQFEQMKRQKESGCFCVHPCIGSQTNNTMVLWDHNQTNASRDANFQSNQRTPPNSPFSDS